MAMTSIASTCVCRGDPAGLRPPCANRALLRALRLRDDAGLSGARCAAFEGADLIEPGGDGGWRRRRRRGEAHGRVRGRRRRRRGVPGRARRPVRRARGRRRAGRVESRGLLPRAASVAPTEARGRGGRRRARDAETASRERLDRRFPFTRLGRVAARRRPKQNERCLRQDSFVHAARGFVVREIESRPRRPPRGDVGSRRERLHSARHDPPGTPRARVAATSRASSAAVAPPPLPRSRIDPCGRCRTALGAAASAAPAGTSS